MVMKLFQKLKSAFIRVPRPPVSILYFAELRKKEKLASLLERTDVTGIFQSFSKGWSVRFENVV